MRSPVRTVSAIQLNYFGSIRNADAYHCKHQQHEDIHQSMSFLVDECKSCKDRIWQEHKEVRRLVDRDSEDGHYVDLGQARRSYKAKQPDRSQVKAEGRYVYVLQSFAHQLLCYNACMSCSFL